MSPPFHGGDTGSIPVGRAKQSLHGWRRKPVSSNPAVVCTWSSLRPCQGPTSASVPALLPTYSHVARRQLDAHRSSRLHRGMRRSHICVAAVLPSASGGRVPRPVALAGGGSAPRLGLGSWHMAECRRGAGSSRPRMRCASALSLGLDLDRHGGAVRRRVGRRRWSPRCWPAGATRCSWCPR